MPVNSLGGVPREDGETVQTRPVVGLLPAVQESVKPWSPPSSISRIRGLFELCLVRGGMSMEDMLTICTDILPQSCLSYLAFRIALHETLERMALAQQIGDRDASPFGYLTEVPFLRCVPPHVQIDLLLETWEKHLADEELEATLVDESVIYAACETAARVVEDEPEAVRRFLERGPLQIDAAIDRHLASELRNLHLRLSNDGDFLLISQFEDMPPDEARRLKKKFRLDEGRLEAMFEVLQYWYVSADLVPRMSGLITEDELPRVLTILGGRVAPQRD